MAISGMESMFRAMGLGQILDMAKDMAENGTFDKILKFADEAEALRNEVREMRLALNVLMEHSLREQHAKQTASIERRDIVAGPDAADIGSVPAYRELLGDARVAE